MISIIIPTYNGEKYLRPLFDILSACPLEKEIIVLVSSSSDDTVDIVLSYGAKVIEIPKDSFNHGGTRTLGAKSATGDILVFMTQDALPVDEHAIELLVKPLINNDGVAASYGRQLPRPDANAFAAHLRHFNYLPDSAVKSIKDIDRIGMKTAFISNSFAAYRRDALERIGWFKDGLTMCEDIHAGARMLEQGMRIEYVAEACVYHSHNYVILKEMRRYYNVGVFYRGESWITERFGKAGGEGIRFVKSEMAFLVRSRKYYLLPESLFRNAMKYLAYQAGLTL